LHQIGDKNWSDLENKLDATVRNSPLYKPRKYFDNLAIAYAACDLAICRSGAMTIAELAVTGTPAIFVPYPFAAADHQTFNARFISSCGAAKVIMQNDLSGNIILRQIDQMLSQPSELLAMKKCMMTLSKPLAAALLSQQLISSH
jgi:UDP-N-acetylglucosamine--N-acetylmuramyl-(pentapeptide) pyrophosphoryl-undecaprenol N-acetylglucosamine transferase